MLTELRPPGLSLCDLRSRARTICLAAALLVLAACAPAMRPDRVPGSFAWFDLVTDDPAAARAFYGKLFGWKFTDGSAENLQIISGNRALIGGLVRGHDEDATRPNAQWQPVLSVADTDAARSAALRAGGQALGDIVETRSGRLAALRDPGGAVLTIYDGTEGIPLGVGPRVGAWVWVDLLTDSPARARTFYRAVAGFETRRESRSGTAAFEVFSSNGRDRGGMIPVSRKQASPGWVPYVEVADLEATLSRARSLGASVPARSGNVAILSDPVGAIIGVAQRARD